METKKFFVKDFIQYCNPCFSCSEQTVLSILIEEPGTEEVFPVPTVITENYIQFQPSVKYRDSLRVMIYLKDQKVVCSSEKWFKDILQTKKLRLSCKCNNCASNVSSNELDFQTFNKSLAPITLKCEYYATSRDEKFYSIYSDFSTQKSIISVRVSGFSSDPAEGTLAFDVKLFPKYQMKNIQKLIDKLDIYAVFS